MVADENDSSRIWCSARYLAARRGLWWPTSLGRMEGTGKEPLSSELEWDSRRGRASKAVHAACTDGNLRMVLEILREDPSLIEAKDELGLYPLHAACANRLLYAFKIVELLVPLSDAVSKTDSLGRFPLHIAVENIGPTHDTQVQAAALGPIRTAK